MRTSYACGQARAHEVGTRQWFFIIIYNILMKVCGDMAPQLPERRGLPMNVDWTGAARGGDKAAAEVAPGRANVTFWAARVGQALECTQEAGVHLLVKKIELSIRISRAQSADVA